MDSLFSFFDKAYELLISWLNHFVSWISNLANNVFKSLISWLTNFVSWIADVIYFSFDFALGVLNAVFLRLFFFLYDFFQFLIDPFISFFEWAFKNSGLSSLKDNYSTFMNSYVGVSYFANYFHLGEILQFIVYAYAIRFLIRRLPVVG